MRWRCFATAALSAAIVASDAHALCIYEGIFSAQTTLAQEFKDSAWVVRAKVVGAFDNYAPENSWTTYRLNVLQAFSGNPPERLILFTFRDSGGFYLDEGPDHNIGAQYLLFLNPNRPSTAKPSAMNGTVSVNYSCGQSKLWSNVSVGEARELRELSAP